jgi:hypothetical protein
MVILMLTACVTTSLPVHAQHQTGDYSESYVLTVQSCHYLEGVKEFTNHSFLVRINSSCLPSDSEFLFAGRYNLSCFSFPLNSTTERFIQIIFEVYEVVGDTYLPCDLDGKAGIGSAEILFDTYSGHWTGEDQLGDESGYGRLNGCDDRSFDTFERDFELCFSLDVIDPDGDSIPRWVEENVYGTDPLMNDANRDFDEDGIPLVWQWRYGYDPFGYDDHRHIDPDNDGLNNYEEYLVSAWRSDPFRKDIFLELDEMELAPADPGFFVPLNTRIQVYQTYAKRNIMFHVDDGCMGGGELLPFDSMVWFGEEKKYYNEYFLHNNPDNWRRGVFRYALYVHDHHPHGLEFPGENTLLRYYKPGLNSYVIATQFYNKYGFYEHSCIMLHELGHTLGMYIGHPFGCDNQLMRNPFSIQRILFKNYESVMNYRYTYEILDYSDGTHGFGDFDDWGKMDLAFFQPDGAE